MYSPTVYCSIVHSPDASSRSPPRRASPSCASVAYTEPAYSYRAARACPVGKRKSAYGVRVRSLNSTNSGGSPSDQ
eukprot:1850670-Prymnesium_polylepis.1